MQHANRVPLSARPNAKSATKAGRVVERGEGTVTCTNACAAVIPMVRPAAEERGETNAKDGWHVTQVLEQGPKSVQSAPAAAAADHAAKMAGASATVELCRGLSI